MSYQSIHTDKAPQAIGSYSQAVQIDNVVYLSGQIPLHPETMSLCEEGVEACIRQVFENLAAVAMAVGGSLRNIVKITVYLTAIDDFPLINQVMQEYFEQPYPARAVVAVAALPKGATIEMDAIMHMD